MAEDGMSLRACYGMSGTGVAVHHLCVCYGMLGNDVAYHIRACYAMPGTDLEHGGTRGREWAHASVSSAIRLRAGLVLTWAVCCYRAMRSLRDVRY
eukprot:3406503-Rhodomonas_salina.1